MQSSNSENRPKRGFLASVHRKAAEFGRDMTKKLVALYFFILAAVGFWALMQLLYYFYALDLIEWIKTTEYIYPSFKYLIDEMLSRSVEGIFYLFMFSSLFFLPVPLEVLFTKLLLEGLDVQTLFIAAFLGLLAGQHLNFFFGKFFGYMIKPFIKRKTQKWVRKKLKKYGVIALFIVNLLPLPFPVFNFVVGLTKFSYFKWALTVSVALALKLGFIILIKTGV